MADCAEHVVLYGAPLPGLPQCVLPALVVWHHRHLCIEQTVRHRLVTEVRPAPAGDRQVDSLQPKFWNSFVNLGILCTIVPSTQNLL